MSPVAIEIDMFIDDPQGARHYLGRWVTCVPPEMIDAEQSFLSGTVVRHPGQPTSLVRGGARIAFDIVTRPTHPRPVMPQSVNQEPIYT